MRHVSFPASQVQCLWQVHSEVILQTVLKLSPESLGASDILPCDTNTDLAPWCERDAKLASPLCRVANTEKKL